MADDISPEFWAWFEKQQKKFAIVPFPKLEAAMVASRQRQGEVRYYGANATRLVRQSE